jgi:nitrite reductase (NADH) large subunit
VRSLGHYQGAVGVHAVGEVALHRGRIYGLVAPCYAMADVLARRLAEPWSSPKLRA